MTENKDSITIDNLDIAEEMYAKYLSDKTSVDTTWQDFFKDLEAFPKPSVTLTKAISQTDKECLVQNLINAYRTYGHLAVKSNPLKSDDTSNTLPDELRPANFGFSENDLKEQYPTNGLFNEEKRPLKDIIDKLKNIYSNKIGFEYMGLQTYLFPHLELEQFIQSEIESKQAFELTADEKKQILHHLNRSELLEVFLHTKYVGQKRFSLEGAETLIPMLEALIEKGADLGIDEFFIGMSHRGRLNVLTNILNKSYKEVFSEFDENYDSDAFEGSGDVKYHKGFASEIKTTKQKKVKISLTPNPSHLESVDPVVEGQVKARQIIKQDTEKEKVLPILIHGDAAVAGQGVVYENMQLGRLDGYSTGGTLHVVVNNQIGFTTIPVDSRSTLYCTDIAKAFGVPVFHVNAEEPESAVFAIHLALKIRQKFHVDVFLDLICYRKYGHNESDEPAFTQPLEYQIIRKKRPIRELYLDQLIEEGHLEKKVAEKLEVEFKESLQKALSEIKPFVKKSKPVLDEELGILDNKNVKTSVPEELLKEIATKFCSVPENFAIHPKVAALIKNRLNMLEDKSQESKSIDWGMAEHLSYATLLWEGVNIRISGQDCGRGTFSHRHGLFVDQVKETNYFPLQHLKEKQGRFDLINSPLSEFAVLGFDYGYNIMTINDLTIWEAQFGDFANSAQVIIDQYIVSAEQKWGQQSSLTLFLPHGFEGQGPEHSSGRLERFLSLAGNNNIQVVDPTTPAQFFHLLRRQILSKVNKPLIVFTPKGLLRHPDCLSSITDFTEGSFQTILEDQTVKNPKRVIFCTGRIYYDLNAARKEAQVEDIAIVRIEQLYPLDSAKIKEIIDSYQELEKCYYVQEEPSNMGAYEYMRAPLNQLLPENLKLTYVGRNRSASPATGSHAQHDLEHSNIMDFLFKEK